VEAVVDMGYEEYLRRFVWDPAGMMATQFDVPSRVVQNRGRGYVRGEDGRFINPPFLFGSGGVELLAAEMTGDLQALAAEAEASPGTQIPLVTKGVEFGSIVFRDGVLDTSEVVGIDGDLVVRPFGRKGEFPTVRAFDIEAMPFHFGMQPVETVGEDVDADSDGVTNEIGIGDISALHIFNTTLQRPEVVEEPGFEEGYALFQQIGCAACHRPELTTDSRYLVYSYPEDPVAPGSAEYYRVDLTGVPGFAASDSDGVIVPLFADLKRHDLGADLAESFGSELDALFTTARLWGVADTAPYLHDGRATTLAEAILWHAGEAQDARDSFAALTDAEREALLALLGSLRTPVEPLGGLSIAP
jgi:hypothetical protein